MLLKSQGQSVDKAAAHRLFIRAMNEYHKDKTKCRDMLIECLSIDTTNPDIYYNLGTVCSELKNFNDSISYFEKALKLAPDNESIIYNLANQFFMTGNGEKALINYERILQKNSVSFDVLYNAGYIYLKIKKDYTKAIKLFKKCIEINDVHLDSYFNLATAYYFDNNFEKAKEMYEKIIMLEEEHFYAYYNLAIVYGYLNAKDKALIILKKYVELSKDIPDQYIYHKHALRRIRELEEI